MVLSFGDAVHGFMLDPVNKKLNPFYIYLYFVFIFYFNAQAIGEFILTDPDMKVPQKGKIYSVNEGYESEWDDPIKQYVHNKKYPLVSMKNQTYQSLI